MQVVRLTPSGVLPVVAVSELALAPPDKPGDLPKLTGRYCWAIYHGEPGPQQWRARIGISNAPLTASRVNMVMALIDYDFELTIEERKHADGKIHERPKLTLIYKRMQTPDNDWLVLCDPMPPFGCRVYYQTTGAVTQVDAPSASYGTWAVAEQGEEVQRFPLPIYSVTGDAVIRWLVVPTTDVPVAGADCLPIRETKTVGFLGSAGWSSEDELWTSSYKELTREEMAQYMLDFRVKRNGAPK